MRRWLQRSGFFGAVIGLAGVWGCAATGGRPTVASRDGKARLFDGLGTHERKVTTSSPDAQRYFNQGLIWAFAFNHDEAIRSFRAAATYDPDCAMAYWGVALCNGPHINNPFVDPEHARAAWEALDEAQTRAAHAAPIERELIAALAARYGPPPATVAGPAERRPLDEAYAAAMRQVWQRHPDDADVGALFAESLMDLQPWDLWTKGGQPKGNTPEILTVLETVMGNVPEHPGACHYYVHAVEASPFPEEGDAAADVLRKAVPLSGHLVHMPSHIDVQRGRWSLAADQNVAAIEADRRYRALSPQQRFYRIYMAHNLHFLSFASMMEGRSEVAIRAAREMAAGVPADFIRDHGPWVDPLMHAPVAALMRFGKWDEILKEPEPLAALPVTRALWRFSRAIAYAAKGELPAAEREQAAFRTAAKNVPPDAMMMVNKAHQVLDIAEHMLAGEIAFRRGQIDDSVTELKQAVALEDQLRYMEPPEWAQPVRHTLGAVLVSAGRYDEAERTYREDLKIWPENGWALHGLAQCLRARDLAREAEATEQRFAKAWPRADVKLETTCMCVPGTRLAGDTKQEQDGTPVEQPK